MQTLRNTSNKILAAFIYFTRLPFYKIADVPRWYYSTVVEHWPLVGWLTGGVMAAVLYFGSWIFPYPVAVILALAGRMLVTGAFDDGDYLVQHSTVSGSPVYLRRRSFLQNDCSTGHRPDAIRPNRGAV